MKTKSQSLTNSMIDESVKDGLNEIRGLRLNIASISDIHINHPNTPTELIIRNLMLYGFPNTKSTHELDIIFIGGDVTHSLMDFASNNAILFRKWVADFLWMCAKNNIMVRIIEGTPLHDWKQSNIFIEENENHSIGCDIRYFTDIHIEHIEKYGIDVLYIPDEIRPTTSMTWDRVVQLLDERGLDKVDFAIMHGAFAYQLPDVADVKDKVHDEEKYLSIVRHYIFIGHVHTHKPKGRIIPNGSFDRLAHNEEEAKGHVRLLKGNIEFVENLGAMRYFQLNVANMDVDEVISLVTKKLQGSQDKFKIKLLANKEDAGFGLVRRLSTLFSYGQFEVARLDKLSKRKEREEARTRSRINLPALTRDNLLDELLKEVKVGAPERFDECSRIAKVTINAVK